MSPAEKSFGDIPIESVKAYWDNRPCNIRHSPKPVGTKEYFDEVEARKYFVEPHIPAFADFERWRDKDVLEIGCGIGTDTMNFARAGSRVVALELSGESMAIAGSRADVLGLTSAIRFVQGNAESLDQIDGIGEYDLVYSFGVLHHTPHPERAFEQILRRLRKGGELRFMVYHRTSWKVFWILATFGKGMFWKTDELIARYSEAQTGCPVTYSYTRQEIKQLLETLGYEVTDVSVDHIFPYKISDYKKYRYTTVWYFHLLPRWFFRQLERSFGWHLLVTARKRRS